MTIETNLETLIRSGNDPNAPIVLWLHGVGSTNAQLGQIASLFDERLTVIAPRGANRLPNGGYAWYEVDFTPQGPIINPEQAEASRQQLLMFISDLQENYRTDKIVMTGFSQGAIMSASVILTEPQTLLGAALFSGRILTEITPIIASREQLVGKPVFIGHGKNDALMPLSVGDANAVKLRELGLNVTYQSYNMGHTMLQDELADFSRWVLTLD